MFLMDLRVEKYFLQGYHRGLHRRLCSSIYILQKLHSYNEIFQSERWHMLMIHWLMCTEGIHSLQLPKEQDCGVDYCNGRIVAKRSGAFAVTTSSSRMKIEAVSAAVVWQIDQEVSHATFVNDSLEDWQVSSLEKKWVNLVEHSHVRRLRWMFCA